MASFRRTAKLREIKIFYTLLNIEEIKVNVDLDPEREPPEDCECEIIIRHFISNISKAAD